MNETALQQRAERRALELPGAELTHPFGENWDVYKVAGKVFMLQTAITGDPMVTLKSAPADSEALCAEYDQITPGYHMNKRHWITIHPGDELDDETLDELVTESYLLVVEKLPKAQRPVDPATFR